MGVSFCGAGFGARPAGPALGLSLSRTVFPIDTVAVPRRVGYKSSGNHTVKSKRPQAGKPDALVTTRNELHTKPPYQDEPPQQRPRRQAMPPHVKACA